MKKILIIGVAVIFAVSLMAVFAAKTHALDPDARVVYEKDDYVWSINVATQAKTKIGKGNFPALSAKINAPSPSAGQNEVAYVLTKDNEHFDAKTDKEGIYIYNFSSGKTDYINYAVSDLTSQLTWSPTSKYLLIETHISTYDTETLITRKGKELMSFRTSGSFRWLSDKRIVYTSFYDVTPLRPRGEGGGAGFGVSKITSWGKNTILKKPDALTDYQFWGFDGDLIQFTKYKVAKQDDWYHTEKIKKSYWKMNQEGKNVKKTYKLVSWSKKIKDALPNKYKNYQVIDYGAPMYEIDYRLFVMNKGYNVEDEEIYVMKVSQSDTLEKLSKGHTPSWGWNLN